MPTIIATLIGIGIFIGFIAVFGWMGIIWFILSYIILGVLAQLRNPGKREDKYGNWR